MKKSFTRHRDDRPSWVRRKSLALRSGNVYRIQEAIAGEKETGYYGQMRTKLINTILTDPDFTLWLGELKRTKCLESVYDGRKENLPDVLDYALIQQIKSMTEKKDI